ncbi:phosphatidate cytidylyltransferase [Hydromonas duriensis]|uniref:Phosphatidate cytidylyltransferase n=1 Tax=Hydromonas duriensis TaxID=1527608 RepID=A0A4V3DK82_9BURK|nr:phosphatidate cytidylyltransferase [Hydromonas duriensis]TDR33080.1 phosphatidate cytidylyltransferase [Hydromonas duriensis]
MLSWIQISAEFQRLMLIVACILIVASCVAYVLRWKVALGQPHAVIDNLIARINAWWVMAFILLACAILGRYAILLLFSVISAVALTEYIALLYKRRGDYWSIRLALYAVIPMQYYLISIDWYGMYMIFIPIYIFFLTPILTLFTADSVRFLERTAKFQWGLMICVFFISHVAAITTLKLNGFTNNIQLVAFLILIVQGSDVLQYIWGKICGKHAIAPKLSPSKTWEGFIGGVLSATLLGAACYWLTPFTPVQAALMSFILCIMGFFGGLVMSAIKRDSGIKDWGNLIEGHGGMLDRLDSIIFSAPVFFHLTRYFWS